MAKFDIHYWEADYLGIKSYGYAFIDQDGKQTSVIVKADIPFEEWKKKVEATINV